MSWRFPKHQPSKANSPTDSNDLPIRFQQSLQSPSSKSHVSLPFSPNYSPSRQSNCCLGFDSITNKNNKDSPRKSGEVMIYLERISAASILHEASQLRALSIWDKFACILSRGLCALGNARSTQPDQCTESSVVKSSLPLARWLSSPITNTLVQRSLSRR